MSAIVSAQNLSKRYGSFEAVRGIDFEIATGECFGLLGPNGAGKSTTIRMICCLTERTGGELSVLGESAYPGNMAIKSRLGVVSQDDYVDPSLTVRENIEIHGRFYGLSGAEARVRGDDLLTFMQLEGKSSAQVRALSGGMRRRLVIARALMGNPDLLILDEPTTGLDPQARILVWNKIRDLRGRGVTILLTTHYMDEAERLADHVVVIDHGEVLERGTPRELIDRVVGADALAIQDIDKAHAGAIDQVTREFDGHTEFQGDDTVTVFGARLDDVMARLQERGLLPDQYYRRKATLEDVFLRLTGRDLRE